MFCKLQYLYVQYLNDPLKILIKYCHGARKYVENYYYIKVQKPYDFSFAH